MKVCVSQWTSSASQRPGLTHQDLFYTEVTQLDSIFPSLVSTMDSQLQSVRYSSTHHHTLGPCSCANQRMQHIMLTSFVTFIQCSKGPTAGGVSCVQCSRGHAERCHTVQADKVFPLLISVLSRSFLPTSISPLDWLVHTLHIVQCLSTLGTPPPNLFRLTLYHK